MEMEFHEAANLFPMEEETLGELAADIKKHGQRVPIELMDGKILDGRRRYKACGIAKVEPKFVEVHELDPVAYVLSLNLHRRNLTPSQVSMVGARAREIYDRQAKERMLATQNNKAAGAAPANLPEQGKGDSRDLAGKAVGVSGKLIDAATKVLTKGVPELVKAVEGGRMAVTTATIVAHEPEEVQRETVSRTADRNYAALKKEKPPPEANRHVIMNGEVYDGLRYADMAIEQLKRIKNEDPTREEALSRVERWIKRSRSANTERSIA